MTSSRQGLFIQNEYFDHEKSNSDGTLFSIVPRGFITYRHMSDDDIFHFNINILCDYGLVSKEYPVFTTDSELDTNLLVEHLNSSKDFLSFCKRQKKGGTRTRLYFNVLGDYQIAIPERDEQKKVAQFLDLINARIAFQQRFIDALKSYKRGLLHAIFAREVVLPKTNSRSWATVKIGDILRILHGRDYKMQPCEIGQYPVWGTGGIITRIDSYMCDWPCVCIGRKGTIDKPIYLDSPFWAVDTLFFSKPIADNDPLFQYYLFQTINWQQYNEASGVPSLSSSTIENIYVDVPDYPSQCAISTFLASIDKRLDVATKISFLLETVKQGLIEKLFI